MDVDPNTVPRGWWQFKDTTGLQTSILAVRDVLMTQRFDVRLVLFIIKFEHLLFIEIVS